MTPRRFAALSISCDFAGNDVGLGYESIIIRTFDPGVIPPTSFDLNAKPSGIY